MRHDPVTRARRIASALLLVTGVAFAAASEGQQTPQARAKSAKAALPAKGPAPQMVLELSNWQLDAAVVADAFVSAKAASAPCMSFARPDATDAPGMKPPPKTNAAAKAQAVKTP